MKTTVDIPDKLLRSVMARSKAQTKRHAIVTALEMYEHRLKVESLLKRLGRSETFMTHEELMEMRNAELKE